MNDATQERLYGLLPAIYRLRDAAEGEPLRALLAVIGDELGLVDDDISRLYDNWFIETCEEWLVPYVGDLVGYRPVPEAGHPGGEGKRMVEQEKAIPRKYPTGAVVSCPGLDGQGRFTAPRYISSDHTEHNAGNEHPT